MWWFLGGIIIWAISIIDFPKQEIEVVCHKWIDDGIKRDDDFYNMR